MGNSFKSALFVALHSIQRMEGHIIDIDAKQAQVPNLSDFLEKAWGTLLYPAKLKSAAKVLYRKINATALDEQEANDEEILFNYYLYSIADLTMFFSEEDAAYLDSPNEWALEIVRSVELGKLLGDPSNAVILTPEQLDSVENSSLVSTEREAQHQDKRLADAVENWNESTLIELKNRSNS